MGEKYFLNFKGESINLFESENLILSEDTLISEMGLAKCGVLNLIDIKVRLIFERFETACHRSKLWQDNLKTLLAHDFDIVSATNNQRLKKIFYPIKFELRPNGFSGLHFGHFHFQQGQSVALQFVKFCKATEYPPNIHKDIIVQTLSKYGGDLVVAQDGKEKSLLKLDTTTGKIVGDPIVFTYLSDPVADHSGQ